MGNFGHDMGRAKPSKDVLFNISYKLGAWRSEDRVSRQMVHKNVGIQEYRAAGWKTGERHALCWGSNSGSIAMRSRLSASPVHLIIPARSVSPTGFGFNGHPYSLMFLKGHRLGKLERAIFIDCIDGNSHSS